jgi:MFS family permease
MSQPQGLTRLEIARGLRWANWDAVFFTLFVALTSGAFQIGLARFFGANDLWIGIITSVPSLAGALQILTAYLADTAPSQKRLVIRYAFYSRLPFVAIAFLPFLGDSAPRLQLFAGLLILSAVLGSFAGPAFLAWLSALVPPDYRGRYFGRRNMILGLVSAASALPPAIFLDQAVKYQRFSEAVAFAVLYGLGALFLFLSLWALRKMPEPPRTPAERKGLRGFWAFYREPFRTPNFRALLGFNTFLVFGQMFAGQFFTVYMLEQIRMPYLMVQVAGLIAALFSSLAMPFWGYLADKFGNKPLLVLSMWGVVFPAVPVVFDRPRPLPVECRGDFLYPGGGRRVVGGRGADAVQFECRCRAVGAAGNLHGRTERDCVADGRSGGVWQRCADGGAEAVRARPDTLFRAVWGGVAVSAAGAAVATGDTRARRAFHALCAIATSGRRCVRVGGARCASYAAKRMLPHACTRFAPCWRRRRRWQWRS